MKIAIITTGNPNNKKGFFNNVNERIKHLYKKNRNLDAFLIQYYNSFLLKIIKRNFKKQIKEEYSYVDGIQYKNLWIKFKLIDYLLVYKLKIKTMIGGNQLHQFVDIFQNYDLISSHSFQGIYLSYLIKDKYHIPFVTTWHGSDINVYPFKSQKNFLVMRKLFIKADYHFFVSKKLMEVSDRIIKCQKKDVLYTGPAEFFYKYNEDQKMELRKALNISTPYVIGFIGNFVPIKNVLILPLIFEKVETNIPNTSFIVVGDGELFSPLSNKLKKSNINKLILLGKQDTHKIPDIINCMDVLVLPSLNEGMPRITLEALACGVNVVGSDVGGIPESIGKENSFALDNDFIMNISNRIIEILKNNEKPPPLSEEFSWDNAVEKEINLYRQIIQSSDK